MLEYKPSIQTTDYIVKDFFSLQVGEKRAYFISENSLKLDSAFVSEYKKNSNVFNLSHLSPPKSNFLIIQESDKIEFIQSVGMTPLKYINDVIKNWNLINEVKTVNNFVCKKAEVHYHGRDWTAWYAINIPLPYGPYKFSGLPGLIIELSDRTGDYKFKFVKSISNRNLKDRFVTVAKSRYTNAKLVTKKEFIDARDSYRENARQNLENMGTVFSQGQPDNQRDRQMRLQLEKESKPNRID